MPLELYRPSRDDARLLSDLLYDGYSDDDVSALMYPVPASEESKASTAKATAESWGKNPREHVLVVRDTELGKSISWGHFFIETEKTGEEWKTFKEREFPPDWNSDFANAALREGWEKRVDIMGSQPYICECSLPMHSIRQLERHENALLSPSPLLKSSALP